MRRIRELLAAGNAAEAAELTATLPPSELADLLLRLAPAELAAVESHVASLALASAPTVAERTANFYERLASGEQGQLSPAEISRRLRDAGSSGFDPLPYLKQLTVPGLWEFGTADKRTPVDESIAILDRLKADGKDITVAIFPGAGHGLLDTPPTDPDAGPTMVRWILDHIYLPQ